MKKTKYKFQIYIAGQTPHSMLALTNLKRFCEKYLVNRCSIVIVDLLREPEKAKKNDIIAIPTIIKIQPKPIKIIIGDFTNLDNMFAELEIPVKTNSNEK